jgi:hypothetical protein
VQYKLRSRANSSINHKLHEAQASCSNTVAAQHTACASDASRKLAAHRMVGCMLPANGLHVCQVLRQDRHTTELSLAVHINPAAAEMPQQSAQSAGWLLQK